MAGDLHVALTSVLSYSSFASIGVVLVGFLIMTIFIIRLNGDQIGRRHSAQPGQYIPARAMVGIHNPFSLKLGHENSASLADGASFVLSCQESCRLRCIWGASINTVYQTMYKPWQVLQEQFYSDTLFEGAYTECSQTTHYDVCNDLEVQYHAESDICAALGVPPRSAYPLVLVIVIPENVASSLTMQDFSIVAMVTIVHLKDSVCTGNSHIISQYVKTNRGHLYNLQQLFMSDPVAEEDSSSDLEKDISKETESENSSDQTLQTDSVTREHQDSSPEGSSSDTHIKPTPGGSSVQSSQCVVCQTERVTRAILPCRHACLCDSCFSHFDHCPMCRGLIDSYFSLDGNNSEQDSWQDSDTNEDGGWMEWWIDANQRLNEWLGFPVL